jgi:hypothetical protein
MEQKGGGIFPVEITGITDEMIEAGAIALAEHNSNTDTAQEGARRIFIEMVRASLLGREQNRL